MFIDIGGKNSLIFIEVIIKFISALNYFFPRLAPPFLITIVIYVKIMPYLGSGPLWTIEVIFKF
jgi:hypothetical protein